MPRGSGLVADSASFGIPGSRGEDKVLHRHIPAAVAGLSVLALLVVVHPASAQSCVNVASDDFLINNSTLLCPGEHSVGDSNSNGVVLINTDNLTLDCNFSTLNLTTGSAGFIRSTNRRNITIKNCVTKGDPGVYFQNTSDSFIVNSSFLPRFDGSNGEGLILRASNNNTLQSNTLASFIIGIDIGASSDSNNNSIVQSKISNVNIGILAGVAGSGNRFIENYITSGSNDGIRLEDSPGSFVENNTILNRGRYGIYLEFTGVGTKNSTFINNTVSGSTTCGIQIDAGSTNNSLYFNNLTNTNQICSNEPANAYNNSSRWGNFWSDLNAANFTDPDGDGFYDSGPGHPYRQSTGGAVSASVVDWGPCRYRNCLGLVNKTSAPGAPFNITFTLRSNLPIPTSSITVLVNGSVSTSFSSSSCTTRWQEGWQAVCTDNETGIGGGPVNISVTAADVGGVSGLFSLNVTAPASVTGLSASVGLNSINWTWTNPTSLNFDHTEVWVNGTFKANVTAPHYNLAGLTPNVSAILSLRTANSSGVPNATWVNDTRATLADRPTGLAATAQSASSASLSWSNATNPASTEIDVFRNGILVGAVAGASYVDSGLSGGTSYTYIVGARNANGVRNNSSAVGVTTPAVSTGDGSGGGRTSDADAAPAAAQSAPTFTVAPQVEVIQSLPPIASDQPVSIPIEKGEVTGITLEANVPISGAQLAVRSYAAPPSRVSPPPMDGGKVFSYLEISLVRVQASDVKRAAVQFKVPGEFFRENSLSPDATRLNVYDAAARAWSPLPTRRVQAASPTTEETFQADVPHFSVFAITAGAVASATPTSSMPQLASPTSPPVTPAPSRPSFPLALIVGLGSLVFIAAVAVLVRKSVRKRKE